jgi:hypothetical protein
VSQFESLATPLNFVLAGRFRSAVRCRCSDRGTAPNLEGQKLPSLLCFTRIEKTL